MGQACINGKPKKTDKTEEKDVQTTDKSKNFAAATANQNQKPNKQNPECLLDGQKNSLTNSAAEVRKNKKICIDSSMSDSLGCFITTENIRNVYNISDTVLGKGTFGTVKEASLISNPSKRFAVKCISKEAGGESKNFDWLYREVSIFRQLDHPNIAKLYECYQDDKHFYLVMENCDGGQLLQLVLEQKRFSEQMASQVMSQMLSAVKYLHELGIVHRDLKPENFLFTRDQSELKMIDFGLSKQYNSQLEMIKYQLNENYKLEQSRLSICTPQSNYSSKSNNMQTIVGTVQYIAPEVLTQNYDKRCDIWSLGVILYCVLYGEFPFTGRNDTEIFEQIRRGNLEFRDEVTISKQAKDLITKMICVDPNKRIDMSSALKHPWFKMQNTHQYDQGRIVQLKHINNLKSYPQKLTPFQRLYIHVYHKMFSNNSFIKDLTRVFRAIDQNNEGIINTVTLQKQMTSLGYNEPVIEIQKIVSNMSESSISKVGQINTKMDEYIEYTQFLEANIDRNILLNEDYQQKIFNYIDTQKKGVILKEDISNCLKREGINYSQCYIKLLKQEILALFNISNNVNQNDQEEEEENKFKIQFSDYLKLLMPAPPTQNSSFVDTMAINDQPGSIKNNQQKSSPKQIK
ncbi:hypothetical protein ABPG74_011418 [Tetrahymena malaccensis]